MADLRHRDFRRKEFDDFARALGRAVLGWNDLQLSIGGIFWAVTGFANGMVPGAIWNSLKVDRAQREMTLALLETVIDDIPKPLREELKWVIKESSNLEEDRNNLVHTPFAVSSHGLIFTLHVGQHKRGLAIQGVDPIAYSDWLYESARLLSSYATDLEDALRFWPNRTVPTRPGLPSKPPLPKKPKRRRPS